MYAQFGQLRFALALALAFFAGSAFPALGLITYYPMLFAFVADHFVYLPSLGILMLDAAGWTARVERLPRPRPLPPARPRRDATRGGPRAGAVAGRGPAKEATPSAGRRRGPSATPEERRAKGWSV